MMPELPALEGLVSEELIAVATGIGAIAVAAIRAYLKGDTGKARGLYVRIENRVRSLLRQHGASAQPAVTELDHETVSDALSDALGPEDSDSDNDNSDEAPKLVLTDGTYSATDADGLASMGAHDILQYAPYRPEVYDCEEFAQLFDVSAELVYGVSAIGVVYDWGAGHAYNVVVLDDGSVTLYEPQDGVVLDVGDEHTFDALTGSTTVTYDPSNALIVI